MEEKNKSKKKTDKDLEKAKEEVEEPVLKESGAKINLASIRRSFSKRLTALKKCNSDLSAYLELLKAQEEIETEDDKRISALLDASYDALSELTKELNKLNEFVTEEGDSDATDAAIKLFDKYFDEKSNLSGLKESANELLSHKWREKIVKRYDATSELFEEVRQQNKLNDELRGDIDKLYKNLSDSQKTIAESSNKFITIVALLVSLLAIIFGNIIQFTKVDLSWQSVVIVNASILLSTCVVFTIVENVHLLSMRGFQTKNAKEGYNNHVQLYFNVVMIIVIVLLVIVLSASVISLSGQSAEINNETSSSLLTSSEPSSLSS